MVDGEGNTALHLAAEAESVEVLSGSGIFFLICTEISDYLILQFWPSFPQTYG